MSNRNMSDTRRMLNYSWKYLFKKQNLVFKCKTNHFRNFNKIANCTLKVCDSIKTGNLI